MSKRRIDFPSDSLKYIPVTDCVLMFFRVVICGGGIIGSCISFYLSERGVASTIVEREEVACAASGKAGGFLALDWNDRSSVRIFTGHQVQYRYSLIRMQLSHLLVNVCGGAFVQSIA